MKQEKRLPSEIIEQVEIAVTYEGYIKRQINQINRHKKMENKRIPEDINYDDIHGLRIEAREKLKRGYAALYRSGFKDFRSNPADITVLLIYLEAQKKEEDKWINKILYLI